MSPRILWVSLPGEAREDCRMDAPGNLDSALRLFNGGLSGLARVPEHPGEHGQVSRRIQEVAQGSIDGFACM